jgi:Cof subfamily protein (haloacid dehalogenase superfamily)
MPEMPPHLFAFDLDGTLIGSSGTISPATRRALHKIRAQGHKIVIITGRSSLEPSFLEPLPLDGYAVLNGVVCFCVDQCTDQLIYQHIFQTPLLECLIRFLPPHIPVVLSSTNQTYATDTQLPALEWARQAGRLHPIPKVLPPQILSLEIHHLEAAQLRPRLIQNFPELKVYFGLPPYPDHLYLMPAGGHKGTALEVLAQHLGIPLERTLVFGDASNDLEMLERAGTSIQVGNLPIHFATHHRVSNPEFGLPQFLERWLGPKV